MINIMRADIYRMSKTKGMLLFWLFTAFIYIISIASKGYGGITIGATFDIHKNANVDIGQLAMNSTFYYFLIIPVFCIITSEFSEHTIKNTISSLVSKRLYFMSKFLFSILYSTFSFILANFGYYAANRLINGSKYSSAPADFAKAFFTQLPMFIAVISALTMFAFLLRKGALYNAVTISAPIVSSMIVQVLMSINSDKELLKKLSELGEKLLYYHVEVMSQKIVLDPSDSYINNCYIICAAVIVLSFIIGYFSFTKRELN